MWRSAAGFTLIEMLVTVVVLGVIVAVSAGAYISVIASARMNGEITSLQGALNLARTEAVKRGLSVSVCPAPGASTSTATCGTGTDWSSGWVILAPSVAPPPLMISAGVTHGDTLTSTLDTYPAFNPSGYTFYSGTITLHDENNTQALYKCIVFLAGAWSVQSGAACP